MRYIDSGSHLLCGFQNIFPLDISIRRLVKVIRLLFLNFNIMNKGPTQLLIIPSNNSPVFSTRPDISQPIFAQNGDKTAMDSIHMYLIISAYEENFPVLKSAHYLPVKGKDTADCCFVVNLLVCLSESFSH